MGMSIQCRYLSKCMDESVQKSGRCCRNSACWPVFGGGRMICVHLLEFDREFDCLCSCV